MKMHEKLMQPLTMSMFLNEDALTKKALEDRDEAASTLQCADAMAACLRAEVSLIELDHPELAQRLKGLKGILDDLDFVLSEESSKPAEAKTAEAVEG